MLLCLQPLLTVFQLQMYIVVVSFIGGGKSTRKNHGPATGHLYTVSHNVVSSTPCHERDSNS